MVTIILIHSGDHSHTDPSYVRLAWYLFLLFISFMVEVLGVIDSLSFPKKVSFLLSDLYLGIFT